MAYFSSLPILFAKPNSSPPVGPFTNSIQQVSITIASGATSNTATISSVGSNAFIVYQGFTQGSSTVYTGSPYLTLTNSTTITATRSTNPAFATTVNAVIIDPTSALVDTVQYGTINTNSTSTATITSVDLTRSAVFFLGNSNVNTSAGLSGFAGVTLTNATTVTTSGTSNSIVSFVVVQFKANVIKSMQQIDMSVSGNTNTAETQTLSTTITPNNSFIAFGGFKIASGGNSSLHWLTITNGTTVTATRNTGTNAAGTHYYYTVVEFVSGVLAQAAQRGGITVTTTSNTATITSAATATSFCNFTGTMSSSGNLDIFNSTVTQTNSTTITCAKNTTGSTITTGYEAITFS